MKIGIPAASFRSGERCVTIWGGRRHAFTLPEVMVALVLLCVGALAMMGGHALVLRQLARAQAQSITAMVVTSRFATLAAQPCSAMASGTATKGAHVTESWTAAPGASSTAQVSVTVTSTLQATPEHFDGIISCR